MALAVLDSSAVIALLRHERGADLIAGYAIDALISAVNLQEVIKILLEDGATAELARELLASLQLELRPHDSDDAWAAAHLYRATKTRGSGLGDRSCMALAIKQGLPAITTDRQWAELAIPGLTVILAR